jgi:Fic family protein
MDKYTTLQELYYRDGSSGRDAAVLAEAKKRLSNDSTFRTGIDMGYAELFLAMPRQLSIINERLLRVERKVSQLWHELPGIAQGAYLRGLIMSEIVSTNEIEGVHSTRRQIEEALLSAEAKAAPKEYKRFREFANLYLELTNKNHVYPTTPAAIRKIYDAVVAGELKEGNQPDGDLFRKGTVDIVDSTQKILHSGVSPESAIIDMLKQMIALVDSPEIPSTFAAIIAHYVFEYVHPFYDGNGRTGRYLLALYLSEPLSLATVLSLSSIIAENKQKYYKAFTVTEAPLNRGELTSFVIQIMEFIRLAQDFVMENLASKKALLLRAEESLDNFRNEPYSLTEKEIKVMFQAVQHFLFAAFSEISLIEIARHSHVGAQTARKYTLSLEEKGLLRSVSFKPLKFEITQMAEQAFGIVEG